MKTLGLITTIVSPYHTVFKITNSVYKRIGILEAPPYMNAASASNIIKSTATLCSVASSSSQRSTRLVSNKVIQRYEISYLQDTGNIVDSIFRQAYTQSALKE